MPAPTVPALRRLFVCFAQISQARFSNAGPPSASASLFPAALPTFPPSSTFSSFTSLSHPPSHEPLPTYLSPSNQTIGVIHNLTHPLRLTRRHTFSLRAPSRDLTKPTRHLSPPNTQTLPSSINKRTESRYSRDHSLLANSLLPSRPHPPPQPYFRQSCPRRLLHSTALNTRPWHILN